MRASLGSFALASVLAFSGTFSSAAYAQTEEDRAGARAAATAGAAAMDQGRWQEAIDLFVRAESLVHAPPHLLFIARGYVKLGKLVRARENYLKITREELPANAPRAFKEAQANAAKESAQIEAQIPTVKFVVQGEGASGATVTMDGAKLPAAVGEVPVPIDPGDHEFQAKTKDLASDVVPAKIAEGARQTITLALKNPLPKETGVATAPVTPPPTSGTTAASSPGDHVPPPDADSSGSKSGLRVGAYVAFGVGAIGLATGTLFLLQNRSKRNDADALCPTATCPANERAEIQTLDDEANAAETNSWIGYGVGAAGVVTGIVLLVLSSGSSSSPAPASTSSLVITPHVSQRGAALTLGSRF